MSRARSAKTFHIFTDGSAKGGNPGNGGWGVVVLNETEDTIIWIESDKETPATNNQMELKAMLCALGYAESHPRDNFIIYSDSSYVVNSANVWRHTWATNGWRNSKKQEVENITLQQALHTYLSREFINVEIKQVRGHNGNVGNELADALACRDSARFKEIVDYWELDIEDLET